MGVPDSGPPSVEFSLDRKFVFSLPFLAREGGGALPLLLVVAGEFCS